MSKLILSPPTMARFFLIALIALITSCNNKKDTPDSPKPDKDTADKVNVALGDLPALCISKQEFVDFYANQPGQEAVFKCVFIFNWDDPQQINPSLTVYRAKPNGKFMGGPVTTLDRKHDHGVDPGEFLFGNLELTKQQADALLALATGNDTGLWFIPDKTNSNHVTYKLYWGDCTIPPQFPAAPPPPDGELNPSPPADPG